MDSSGTAFDLLAHFDSPNVDENLRPQLRPFIGVASVLKWGAASAVLFFAASVLLKLGYCIAAEQALTHAARAAALEATLPRATRQTIVATVERRMLSKSIGTAGLQIHIQNNNDDQVAVMISVPTNAVLPPWLNAMPFHHGDVSIEGHATRSMPSRRLPRY
jgi:hypothetical protein